MYVTMEKKINRFIKIFPWYQGFIGDLLFYIAIDTLFLTMVKNFSPAQIVFLTSFSQITCIALQFPILFIIRNIGNTNASIVRALCMLLSAMLITFGKSFPVVLLGRVFHDVAGILSGATIVALENNLDLIGCRHKFVPIRTAANTVYSVITMLISFVASLMFNLNHYLPMIGCITTCSIAFFLSFYMKDYSPYNKISNKVQKGERWKINYSKFIIMAIVVYAIYYPVVGTGQAEGKLFIQQQLLLDFNVDQTSLILGAVVCISRIIRVFSNLWFAKIYSKHQEKTGVALPILLCSALGFLLFGSFVPMTVVKIVIMAMGYIIILFARDPFKLYMQDVIFENTPKEQHQTLITVLEFGVKIGTAGMGLSFAAILTEYPMTVVMAIIFMIALIEVYLSVMFYRIVMMKKVS